MAKSAMKMLIGDEPVQEALMAKAKSHHDRTCEIGALVNTGHVTVMVDDDPLNIRLRIEDEFFAEPRTVFPSEAMVARLHLAIHAGRSDRNLSQKEHAMDAMSYGLRDWKTSKAWGGKMTNSMQQGASFDEVRVPDMYAPFERKREAGWLDAIGTGYENVRKITAKVTSPKLRKGLRP